MASSGCGIYSSCSSLLKLRSTYRYGIYCIIIGQTAMTDSVSSRQRMVEIGPRPRPLTKKVEPRTPCMLPRGWQYKTGSPSDLLVNLQRCSYVDFLRHHPFLQLHVILPIKCKNTSEKWEITCCSQPECSLVHCSQHRSRRYMMLPALTFLNRTHYLGLPTEKTLTTKD